jgi:hypothetical protein
MLHPQARIKDLKQGHFSNAGRVAGLCAKLWRRVRRSVSQDGHARAADREDRWHGRYDRPGDASQ